MTAILALIRKDLILYKQDRRALMLNLVMPILLATFFGYLFGGSGQQKPSKIEIALVQNDTSDIGKKIAAGLKADENLTVTEMPLAQAEELVRKGKQKTAIVIPAGFGDAAGAAMFNAGAKPEISVLYDPSQNAVMAMVNGMLTQHVMQTVSADMFGGKGGQKFTETSLKQLEASSANPELREMLASLKKFQDQRPAKADGGAQGGLSMPFTTKSQALVASGPAAGYNGYAHSFAGMSVQFILFMGIDMGIGILLARRLGIWNRLLAAPITQRTVLVARGISGAIIAMGLICVIFAFAAIAFHVTISSMAGFVGVSLSFALLTASFGLLIAAFGKTPEAARGMAVFATLIMVMLGGAWVPSFMFPSWVQDVALVMPTRWAIDGLDAVTWRGLGLDAVLPIMGAELAFTALFATLAIWRFNKN